MFPVILPKEGLIDTNPSVLVVQGEDGVGGFAEVAGDLQRQDGGGDVSAGLDGVDGVAADADGVGQLLLGDVPDGSLDSNGVLHKACSFRECRSIILKTR